MRHMTATGLALLTALSAGAACASTVGKPPTQQQRDAIEAKLSLFMVLPETTIWRFAPVKPYLGDQVLVCGQVNFQAASRKYIGFRRFYATLDDNRVTLAQLEDQITDPSGRMHQKIDLLCGKA